MASAAEKAAPAPDIVLNDRCQQAQELQRVLLQTVQQLQSTRTIGGVQNMKKRLDEEIRAKVGKSAKSTKAQQKIAKREARSVFLQKERRANEGFQDRRRERAAQQQRAARERQRAAHRKGTDGRLAQHAVAHKRKVNNRAQEELRHADRRGGSGQRCSMIPMTASQKQMAFEVDGDSMV